jgi:hypothetical protein
MLTSQGPNTSWLLYLLLLKLSKRGRRISMTLGCGAKVSQDVSYTALKPLNSLYPSTIENYYGHGHLSTARST